MSNILCYMRSLCIISLSLMFLSPASSETYKQWMRSHNLDDGFLTLTEDSDFDGMPNALEYALGTNPREKSRQCLKSKIKNGKWHFEHSVKSDVENTNVRYLWSKDLINYQASGESSEDGTIVVISENTTDEGNKEIASDVVSGEAPTVFLRMVIPKNKT